MSISRNPIGISGGNPAPSNDFRIQSRRTPITKKPRKRDLEITASRVSVYMLSQRYCFTDRESRFPSEPVRTDRASIARSMHSRFTRPILISTCSLRIDRAIGMRRGKTTGRAPFFPFRQTIPSARDTMPSPSGKRRCYRYPRCRSRSLSMLQLNYCTGFFDSWACVDRPRALSCAQK